MTWLEALHASAVAIVLFVVPGAPFAILLGLRGAAALGVAVAASVGIVGAASLLAPLLGLDWGLLPVGIVAALILATLLPGMGSPQHPSQTYDALFHLNAIRWIADTADASPLHMTMTTPAAASGFYPTTWHAFAALAMQATGSSVVVTANAVSLAVAAFVWPVACAFLARMLFGSRPLVLVLGSRGTACCTRTRWRSRWSRWHSELSWACFAAARAASARRAPQPGPIPPSSPQDPRPGRA